MDSYQKFIHLSRYSRFLDTEGRRETWPETVSRVMGFWRKQIGNNVLTDKEFQQMEDAIYNLKVMPSMRSMWSAGDALALNHFRGYNCAFAAVDHIRVFDEILFILMSGTGFGFSIESKYVSKLPIINDNFVKTDRIITIGDSAEGWSKALRKLVADLYLGNEHEWDYSEIRPEGARLKTMGGRASGPQPLMDLFAYVTSVFKGAAGRKLTTQEVHDIVCKEAEIVVVGGVRRSALISLSDLGDVIVRDCKSVFKVDEYVLVNETDTHWEYALTMKKNQPTKPTYMVSFEKGTWEESAKFDLENNKTIYWNFLEKQRALSNNSAVYESKPSMAVFMDEWVALMKSGSGERGIFNRAGAKAFTPTRRDSTALVGTNPCAEIQLRNGQLCNLTEVVGRAGDSVEDLKEKVRIAAIIGTLQSSLTDFKYVRKIWIKNCEEERLLGVSLTGIQDCELLQNPTAELLRELKQVAVNTNIEFAKRLGINPSTAVTTVKPSGTVSQLVDSASGIHGRFAKFYIRSVRQANSDPLTQMLKDQGVPNEPDAMNPEMTTVFYFPIKAPKDAVFADEQGAIQQLENWKMYQEHWSEHSVSVTVYVKEHEWLTVGDWVYQNFDYITGVSFLPYSEHTYQQAPYTACNEGEYLVAKELMPDVDFSQLVNYESEDNTEGAATLACGGGGCEI
jgi:ribonucleoside-triphosphate reductase